MTFGEALEALKKGERAARSGWNGKGMWVALTPGTVLRIRDDQGLLEDFHKLRGAAFLRGLEIVEGNEVDTVGQRAGLRQDYVVIREHLDMRAADGTMVIGWLASQTDMVADDWTVLS